MRARTENVSKHIQIDTHIILKSMEIEAETMFGKVLQTTQKTIQHRVQLNTNNILKTLEIRHWKTILKVNGKEHPEQFLDSQTRPSRGVEGGTAGIILYCIKLSYIN